LMAGSTQTFSLPSGPYADSCDSCSISNNVLTCTCGDGSGGEQQTSYQNPYACDVCLNNIQGSLVCPLPTTSTTNSYQAVCTGCGISFNTLYCSSCNGQTNVTPLANACDCDAVQYISGTGLVCTASTPVPTQPTKSPTTPSPTNMPSPAPTVPTNSPSTPTGVPTPPLAPVCQDYWLSFATEAAPWRPCTDFTSNQGCTHQNWCCFQTTGSGGVGVCKVPNGVPADCPNLTTQSTCNSQGGGFCAWNANYGTSGLCQRICPGNPLQMCV